MIQKISSLFTVFYRRFSKLILFILAATLVIYLSEIVTLKGVFPDKFAEATSTTKKPNIVIIMADDLGWNDVGFHGSEIKTQNLDKLAESSLILDRFYVNPICTATRAALMTGRHPSRYGMSQGVIWEWTKTGLPRQEKTIAQTLKENGYFTAIVGKWHLGHYKKEYLPTQRGFDYHYGFYGGTIDYFTHKYRDALDWHRNEVPLKEEGYSTDLIGKEAIKLINNNDYDSSPLFLFVSFNAPHSPLQAKEEDIEDYQEIEDEGRRTYAAQVQSMDKAIGKIIAALKAKQIWENTLLIFTSDNGGATNRKFSRGDNRPLKGEKGTLYEGGVRVPAMISYPAQLPAGSKNDTVFSIVDLYPTFSKLAGANDTPQNKLDGINILDTLKQSSSQRDELLIHYKNSETAALIKGDWKLVKNGMGNIPGVPYHGMVELFNIKDDPRETHNLVYAEVTKVNEMEKILQEYGRDAKNPITPHFKPTQAYKAKQKFTYPKVFSPDHFQSLSTNKSAKKKGFLNKIIFKISYLPRSFISLISFVLGGLVTYLLFKFFWHLKLKN